MGEGYKQARKYCAAALVFAKTTNVVGRGTSVRDESVVQRVDYRSRCYACKSFKRLSLSVYATCIPFKRKDGGREKASEVMTIHPSIIEGKKSSLSRRKRGTTKGRSGGKDPLLFFLEWCYFFPPPGKSRVSIVRRIILLSSFCAVTLHPTVEKSSRHGGRNGGY